MMKQNKIISLNQILLAHSKSGNNSFHKDMLLSHNNLQIHQFPSSQIKKNYLQPKFYYQNLRGSHDQIQSPKRLSKITLDINPKNSISFNPELNISYKITKPVTTISPNKQTKSRSQHLKDLKDIKNSHNTNYDKSKKNINIMQIVRDSVQAYLIMNKMGLNSNDTDVLKGQKIIKNIIKFPSIQNKNQRSTIQKTQVNNKMEIHATPDLLITKKKNQKVLKKSIQKKKAPHRYLNLDHNYVQVLVVDGVNQSERILEYREKRRQSFREKFNQIKQEISSIKTQQQINDSQKQQKIQISKEIKSALTNNKVIESKKQKKASLIIKQKQCSVYQHKIKTYRDFIFQINFAHQRFDPIVLKDQFGLYKTQQKRFKVYIGRGNNSLLIQGLMKRRFWWAIQDQMNNCNFVWTQLKINNYFQLENRSQMHQCIGMQDDQEQKKEDQKQRKIKKIKQSQNIKKNNNKFKPTLPIGIQKIFIKKDLQIYKKYESLINNQQKMQDYENRLKLIDKKLIHVDDKFKYKVHNHLQNNFYLGNKKAMFYNLRQYYLLINKNVFDYLPLTFHIKKGQEDRQFKEFLKYYRKKQSQISKKSNINDSDDQKKNRNIWIIKPGQNSNRGNGITVVDQLNQLTNIIKKKQFHPNGNPKTYILQQYILRPLLYNKRKFDIRHYMLITTLYGKMRGYWYSQGYIRTSSYKFDIDDVANQMIHLTNDAIQKHGQDYGKYEQGNKISYAEFQKYLDTTYPGKNYSFYDSIYPKMRQVALDSIRASYIRLDPKKLEHNFQIFGLDFMIDEDFNVWLIQINTNPCLQISSGLLGRIIPTMVQHSFRLSIDVLFPPLAQYPNTMKHLAPDNALQTLKYELIFDEQSQSKELNKLYKNNLELDCGQISQQEETYEDEGKQCDLDVF